jgi:type IV secretory pathway VirB2 component (pilin)
MIIGRSAITGRLGWRLTVIVNVVVVLVVGAL